MIITITWTKILVITLAVFAGRYAYYTWMKLYTGCQDPYDPTVFYKTSSYTRGWNMGHIHGSFKMKAKYEKSQRELKAMRQRYEEARTKLSAVNVYLND